MTHTIKLPNRKAKVHHATLAAKARKTELIKDIAAIMGDELDTKQLAKEVDVHPVTIYYTLKSV